MVVTLVKNTTLFDLETFHLIHSSMKVLTLPVIRKFYTDKIGKTAIECKYQDSTLTVFANGDVSLDNSLLCNVQINEVGDKFTATRDSSTIDDKTKKPIYMKGDVVTRQKASVEFKSFAGNNTPAQFAQSAAAFGLQLNVVMQG